MKDAKDKVTKQNPYDQFDQWLVKQPFWVQDATWRLYNQRPIDDNQILRYVQMCLDEAQGKSVEHKQLNQSTFSINEVEPQIAIKSIKCLVGVNALAQDICLHFGNEGVSVVYGLNGAGKTGFMRILKHVSGNPYAESIQQNVFKTTSEEKPSCKFDISIGGEDQTLEVDLSKGSNNPYLSQCDVFDTRISTAYISNANSVSYEPFVFTVLKELAVIATRTQHAIQDKIDMIPDIELNPPDYVKNYIAAKWIEQLGDKSIVPTECLSWGLSDTKRIDELNKLLDTKQVQISIRDKEYQLGQIRRISTEINDILERVTEDMSKTLEQQFEDFQRAKERYELARIIFANNATNQDKLSINLDDFRTLWKVGRSYYEKCLHEANGKKFAEPGSICPLCLQQIGGDSIDRFSSVDEYVNGEFSDAYYMAENNYRDTIKKIISHKFTSAQISDTLRSLVDEELIKKLADFYDRLDELEEETASKTTYMEIISFKEKGFVKELAIAIEELESEINVLKEALNEEAKGEYKKELQHLQYRNWTFNQIELIRMIIENDKRKKELESGLQLLKTNKITLEANQLAEVLITDAYISRFNKEMRAMAPNLKVKLEKGQSQKGRSPYKVVLDTAYKIRKNPEEILSEGEQRIVALAAFFADATGRNGKTPIIIDDPISSLDYNYEEAATRRIAELGKERQVIVFTHRISLLVGLEDACKYTDIPFTDLYIRRTNEGTGVPECSDVYHGKIDKQLNGLINRIQEIKKLDPYSREYQDACSRVSQQLRICIERSVEDVLLLKTVKRFSRKIMTGKLMKLDRITSDDCVMIDSMMTKYSFYEHSQPEDSPAIHMNLDDIIEDIKTFVSWIKSYNKKME